MMGISQHFLFVGLVASLSLLNGTSASAGLMVSAIGTTVHLGFDGYQGDGFAPDPSPTQLDSDHWRITGLSEGAGTFGGTHTAGDFARGSSSGGVSTGGVYGFDVGPAGASNWSLGFQPIGSDLTPGWATLMVTNATGVTVDRLDLAYQVLVRNDGDRASSFSFSYSFDDADYLSLGGLDVTSGAAAETNPQWFAFSRGVSLSGLNLGIGTSMFLRWGLDDAAGTGNRDEWALDGVNVTLDASTLSPVPEPSSWILLSVMLCPSLLWRSRRGTRVGDVGAVLHENVQVHRCRTLASIETIPISK